ncbi:MAG: hypothetical protein JWO41_797 [Candidatus Saccharibacteria bacterium]|nr:hypothetical protein [Candidatus Saccharibacteria bacterium]
MGQTIETLQETTAELDRHFASTSNRITNLVSVLMLSEVLIAGTAIISHESPSRHDSATTHDVGAEEVSSRAISTTNSTPVPPRPVSVPRFLTPAPPKHKPVYVTDLHAAVGYPQIILPLAPVVAKASKPHFNQLIRSPKPEAKIIADISYPQCEDQTKAQILADKRQNTYDRVTDHVKASLKTMKFDYLFIGATGGRNFRSNRCLKEELALTRDPKTGISQPHGIYVNSGPANLSNPNKYQDAPYHCTNGNRICLSRNAGIQAGRYAVLAVYKAGGTAPEIFAVDVERANGWGDASLFPNQGTTAEHVANLQGMEEALLAASPRSRIVYYSVPARAATAQLSPAAGMWGPITGGWLPKNRGSWIAGGNNTPEGALASCRSRPSITATSTELSQYVYRDIDWDVICPERKTAG